MVMKGRSRMSEIAALATELPLEGRGQRSSAWWGMLCLIATEAILFVYLIFSYAYLGAQSTGAWPPTGNPSLLLAGPDTIVLLTSSFVLEWGLRAFAHRRSKGFLQAALATTIIMGAIFVVVQGFEWHNKPFKLS